MSGTHGAHNIFVFFFLIFVFLFFVFCFLFLVFVFDFYFCCVCVVCVSDEPSRSVCVNNAENLLARGPTPGTDSRRRHHLPCSTENSSQRQQRCDHRGTATSKLVKCLKKAPNQGNLAHALNSTSSFLDRSSRVPGRRHHSALHRHHRCPSARA